LVGFAVLLFFFVFAVIGFGAVKAFAQTQEGSDIIESAAHSETEPATDPGVVKYAFLAAAIAVGVGSLGGGAAVGYVGAAAMGAIGEKPELAGRALIFVGLAEGIAIYGLIIAIMILGKV
jgi:V/A-type H+-transporting ATPase subunit K